MFTKVLIALAVVIAGGKAALDSGRLNRLPGMPEISGDLKDIRELVNLGEEFLESSGLSGGGDGAGGLGENGGGDGETKILSGQHIEAPGLSVRFLDVGQADSILVSCGDEYLLVDAGNRDDGAYIVQALRDYGVDALDAVIFTHPHEDHIGGGSDVLEGIPVEMIYRETDGYDASAVSEDLTETAERLDIPWTDPAPGDQMQVGDAAVTFLGPISYDSDNPNNNSIAIRLQYGEVSFLLTGDGEREEEADILDSGADVSCDVMKLGHHGSSNASSYVFLREAMPEAVVISCGYDNKYGHPHEETMSRIEDLGASVYRTDEIGTVAVFSDGSALEFAGEPSVHSDRQEP